jgi:hypothetical protein
MNGSLDPVSACALQWCSTLSAKCASRINKEVGHLSEEAMEAWEMV